MTRRYAPRPAASALRSALERAAPKTRLAAVQSIWTTAVGERVAAMAEPVSESGDAVVIDCADSVWVQELDMMQRQLLARLQEHLGEQAPDELRFRVKRTESNSA